MGSICEEIVKLWAELGTPQVQTDSAIVQYYRDAPEQLGLHASDLLSLKEKREKLLEEKRGRERKLKELRTAVESLWDRLGVEECDRKAFLAVNRGCGLRTINEFEEELGRLNELKHQNLHLFVEDARCRLQELWDALYYSEEEMLDFTPAFSDVYSDALLSAHENEITRLETLREQRAPALDLIDKHRSLINDRDSLAASSQDASRLMARGNKGERRDPTRLLREEKMRKRIAKELPKVEEDLRKALENWEDEFGRPFLVHGERYLDEIVPRASAKVPPRSKTPSGQTSNSRPNSARPASSLRGGATSRAGTAPKTPTRNGSIRRPGPPQARNTNPVVTSPSKIPSRVPLSNMPHGNNSPERRPTLQSYAANTISGKMPPPRAPPPKMRELRPVRSQDASQSFYHFEHERPGSVLSNSLLHSQVRPISPEDIYDDRSQNSYLNASITQYKPGLSHTLRNLNTSMTQNGSYYHNQNSYLNGIQEPQSRPPSAPSSRQTSNNSTIHTVASGSENWETYDDASEPEVDATEVYYSKLRAAQGKRLTPEAHYGGIMGGKKMKGIRGVGPEEPFVEENGHIRRVDGSDAGWTDDMETY